MVPREVLQSNVTNWQILQNRLLRERLEKAPVVYGHVSEIHKGSYTMWATEIGERTELGHTDTHTARLVCVEEIKKECP